MKKVIIAIVAICSSYIAQSQTQSLGPTVGFNYAWLSDVDNSTPRPAINIGLTYNYSILESAGLGIEARYSEEGVKQEIGNTTYTTKLNYIRVPLKFQYFFGELGDNFRPKIFAGPSFAFLVGGESEVQSGEVTTTVNSKDFYNGFDVALQAGAGFNYRLASRTWLNFDVAYTHGFLEVAGDKSNSPAKNRMVNVNLGVAFGF